MHANQNESGFSLIETIVALVVLLIGILGTMGAISYGILYMQEAEKRTQAKEVARSTMETIFSIRDLQAFDPQTGEPYNWDTIQTASGTNNGVFLSDWTPIRENPGDDGIFGTADDACAGTSVCTVGSYTNTSAIVKGFQRKIDITDLVENNSVKKRLIKVRISYYVGQLLREEAESTIVANLPVN